ncbi:MAG: hypothetical protein HY021_12420 [Burkholderiales bacterium]|nr:hypothetical protein [Burkholderiales bacterium]
MPRLLLLLLCAAYVLPGLFDRDPWRGPDLTAFGQMLALAQGRTAWLAPTLGGVPTDAALLPHWIGAASIALGSPWLDPAFAARLPFALLLALTLAAVWFTAFQLARTEPAQPLAFAFGGEADVADYARAIADGALLAIIATLGLLQLGHETTPEIAQLAALACAQWAMAAAPYRRHSARITIALALPALAACGAPAMALAIGLGWLILAAKSHDEPMRAFAPWLAMAIGLSLLLAWQATAWRWRVAPVIDIRQLGRLFVWFLWPAWVLACWTLWRWRGYLIRRHIAVPVVSVGVACVTAILMGGFDRALMLALPGIAPLAALALPTIQRSARAAMDWFSVFFFTLWALTIWVIYASVYTGVPAQPAANVMKLAVGFVPGFSMLALGLAIAATLAWVWLVRWRTGRHREALWKSLVLPAGGVALCWLLVMSLGLPLVNYARSYRPLVERIDKLMPAGACVAAPGASTSLVAALEFHAKRRVEAHASAADGRCPALVLVQRTGVQVRAPVGWEEVARERRPTDRAELTLVYRRKAGS